MNDKARCWIEPLPDGGHRVHYDVTGVPVTNPAGGLGAAPPDDPPPRARPAPGTFDDRVSSRQVDLGRLVRYGVPEVEYLPASEGMLVRGKRHLIAAPAKTGKSIGMEAHWVDMALAGAGIAILDRENGSRIYARRLADIYEKRRLGDEERARVEEQIVYIEYPKLQRADGPSLAAALADFDVVVFDAQRMFLTDLNFKEGDADDYAQFMGLVIDPLFQAGIATVILDNTGHKERTRSRGSATKGDLNEVLFSMKAESPFDLYTTGQLKLTVEASRFGNRGVWTMDIGGGTYGSWSTDQRQDRPDFLAAVRQALAETAPLGQDKLLDACRRAGVKVRTDDARRLLGEYTEQGLLRHSNKGYEMAPDHAR